MLLVKSAKWMASQKKTQRKCTARCFFSCVVIHFLLFFPWCINNSPKVPSFECLLLVSLTRILTWNNQHLINPIWSEVRITIYEICSQILLCASVRITLSIFSTKQMHIWGLAGDDQCSTTWYATTFYFSLRKMLSEFTRMSGPRVFPLNRWNSVIRPKDGGSRLKGSMKTKYMFHQLNRVLCPDNSDIKLLANFSKNRPHTKEIHADGATPLALSGDFSMASMNLAWGIGGSWPSSPPRNITVRW